MKKTFLPLLAAASAVFCSAATAQTVFTIPAGYVTVDLEVGFNPIGVNVHNSPVVSGQLSSENFAAGSSQLSDGQSDYAALLNKAGATFLFEITSGTGAGTVAEIESFTSSGFVVASGSAFGANGSSYNIREAMTLSNIFGSGADLKIQGGNNSGVADIVFVPNGSGGYDQFYFNTRSGGFLPAGTAFGRPAPISVFYPDGLLVQVKSINPEPFQIFGEVKTSASAISTAQGFSLVSVPSPVGQTLRESNLQNLLTSGPSSGAADIIFVPNGGGGYTQYFFRSGVNQWRLVSAAFGSDQGDVELSGALLIQRKSSTTSGLFELPRFFNAL